MPPIGEVMSKIRLGIFCVLVLLVMPVAALAQLTITTTSLPDGVGGVPYSATFTASGGTAPYTWIFDPLIGLPGLALSSTGVLSGTPTKLGLPLGYPYQFTVQVKDAAGATARRVFTFNIQQLYITNLWYPAGNYVGVPFNFTLTAGGTRAPYTSYTWALVSGTLPPGLTLSSAGLLSGTPSAAGWYPSIRVSVGLVGFPGTTASTSFPITILTPAALKITTTSLPTGYLGKSYSATLAATGGIAPYSWELDGGTLPAGLTLSPAGTLRGTPSVTGGYGFTVRIYDSAKVSVRQGLPITISK